MKRLLAVLLLGAAPAEAQDLLLVGNKQDADVSVIDVKTGKTVKRIATGVGPHEIAISPNARIAVVANYGAQPAGNSLSVIDTRTLEVIRTISLDTYSRPHGVAFLPDNQTVAVTSETTRSVVLVNVNEGRITNVIATDEQGTHMVSVSADGRRAFTANIGSGSASEIDLENGALIRNFDVAPQAEAVNLTPDGKEVWVGSNGAGTVTVFDVATQEKIATLPAPGVPIRVYFSPDGGLALVSSAQAQTVRFFDARKRNEVAAIKVSGTPIGAVFAPDGTRAFVALTGANAVAVIDTRTFEIVASHPTGTGPDGIAYLRR